MLPLSDPRTSHSSDDSIHEELQSLKRTSTSQGISPGIYKLADIENDSCIKAHSTNSSPLRNKLFENLPPHRSYDSSSEESSVISYPNYSEKEDTNDQESDNAAGDKVADGIKNAGGDAILTLNKPIPSKNDLELSFDPFQEPDIEEPIANSTTQLGASKPKKYFKISKTVRFRDWENPIDPAKRSVQPKKKSRLFHRSKTILKNTEKKFREGEGQRLPSSDYTATPDVTAAEDIEVLAPPRLSENQLPYNKILPDVIEPIVASSNVKSIESTSSSSKYKLRAPEASSVNLPSGASLSSNQTSFFSKQDSGTEVSSSRSSILDQQVEKIPHKSLKTAFKNFGKTSSDDHQPDDQTDHKDDMSLLLTRRFNKLSIKTPESKYKQQRPLSSQKLLFQAPLKGFSLKLERKSFTGSSKQSNSHETPEASFDQIDILDQKPPELPDITNDIFSEPPQTFDSTIPLFDSFVQSGTGNENLEVHQLKEKNEQLKKQVETTLRLVLLNLSKTNENIALGNTQAVQLLNVTELLGYIEEEAQLSCRKVESFKIQQIKINKQINDQESSIKDKELENKSLKKKINDLLNELETKNNVKTLLETRLKSQIETMSYERDLRTSQEKNMSLLKSKLDKQTAIVENKDELLKECTRAVKKYLKLFSDRFSLDYSILDSFSGSFTEYQVDLTDQFYENTKVSSQLKALLNTVEGELDKMATLKESNVALEKKVTRLEASLSSEEGNKYKIQTLLDSKAAELVKSKNQRNELSQKLEETKIHMERYKQQLKLFEHADDEIKTALKDGALKLQELETRNQQLIEDKRGQERRIYEMENLLKEQMKLVEEANIQIESQSGELLSLHESLEVLNDDHTELTKVKESLQTKANYLSQKIEERDKEIQELKSLEEKSTKHAKLTLKSKEEDLKGLEQRATNLEEAKESLCLEIRDIRTVLSERTTSLVDAEKKIGSLNKGLQESHEANRSLRSDILKNGIIKQDLKRTLIGICVGLVKEFEGIIDDVSLNTIKNGLQCDVIAIESDEEKQIVKLKDASMFIEEAISLIVKEYWSLNKKVSDSHKTSLSSSSSDALKRINELQLSKVKKMESKVHFYESLFKKINNVNERPRTTQIQSSNSQGLYNHVPSQTIVHFASETQPKSSAELQSDNESVKSTATVLREKQQEINRLLSKVGRKAERYNLDY